MHRNSYDRKHRKYHSAMKCKALQAFVTEERSKHAARRFLTSQSERIEISSDEEEDDGLDSDFADEINGD